MQRPFRRIAQSEPPTRGGAAPEARSAGLDLRCGCHRLLTRAVAEGIELRCPRCKTDTLLRWEQIHALEAQARLLRPR